MIFPYFLMRFYDLKKFKNEISFIFQHKSIIKISLRILRAIRAAVFPLPNTFNAFELRIIYQQENF